MKHRWWLIQATVYIVNRLRTFLEQIVFGKTLFTLFVISVNLYLLSVFTQRKIFLDTYLWPVIARHFPTDEYIFQDDNAPVHACRETTHWKQENNIKCMTWPSQSPDLTTPELILPHNIADNLQLPRSPRHSGGQTSSGRLRT
jgi:hypothetical protein